MSWFKRQFGQIDPQGGGSVSTASQATNVDERMSPGLNGQYDWEVRMKAGMHEPPPLPEYMGLEGEYDPQGLAKRVALALDRELELDEVQHTLSFTQIGSTIVFKGTIPCQSILERIVDITARVDGTKAVDINQVTINS